MLTDDSPEQEFHVYDSEGLPVVTLDHGESISLRNGIYDIKPFKSNGKSESLVVRCGGLIWVRQITA